MRFVVKHPDGRVEEGKISGENFALGLAAVKHTCVCGRSEFVDGGNPLEPDERPPDRVCSNCSREYWYYEDDEEHAGYLHSG